MNIDPRRRVDRDIDVLVGDDIVGNDGSIHRRTAAAAVDIDAHASARRRVIHICKILGDVVADDHIAVHVVCRQPEIRSNMGVQRDAADSVAD